jgi:hypothetical protein
MHLLCKVIGHKYKRVDYDNKDCLYLSKLQCKRCGHDRCLEYQQCVNCKLRDE